MNAARAHAWRDARRILAVRLDNLGDVLMTTPALRAQGKPAGAPRHLAHVAIGRMPLASGRPPQSAERPSLAAPRGAIDRRVHRDADHVDPALAREVVARRHAFVRIATVRDATFAGPAL